MFCRSMASPRANCGVAAAGFAPVGDLSRRNAPRDSTRVIPVLLPGCGSPITRSAQSDIHDSVGGAKPFLWAWIDSTVSAMHYRIPPNSCDSTVAIELVRRANTRPRHLPADVVVSFLDGPLNHVDTEQKNLAAKSLGAVRFLFPRVCVGIQVTRSVSEGGRSTVLLISDHRRPKRAPSLTLRVTFRSLGT